MKQKVDILILFGLIAGIFILFSVNILSGDVSIGLSDTITLLTGGEVDNKSWSYIIENRLNRSLMAIGAGGGLALAGLILQVFFRNPLAGPGVLGITSGASLGVAVVILGGLTLTSVSGNVGIIIAGICGAILVLLFLLFISKYIKNSVTLLVAGLMFGYFTSAIINILYLWASETNTRAYVIWGLGSFDGVTNGEMLTFFSVLLFGVIGCILLIKPLNALVIGPEYASSLGINIRQVRLVIILITGIIAAIITVYCGPVSFIGVAVPQLIRLIVKSKNHSFILPVTFLGGGLLALLSDILVRLSSNSLPLNTVTALIGAPVIIAVIVKLNKQRAVF